MHFIWKLTIKAKYISLSKTLVRYVDGIILPTKNNVKEWIKAFMAVSKRLPTDNDRTCVVASVFIPL